jgi:hypothetical protein
LTVIPTKNWEPVLAALVKCPECNREVSLGAYYIKDDGRVAPSLECPHLGCTFHDFVTLAGWKPEVGG